MARKTPTVAVKFTVSELDLIYTDMNVAIESGGEDPDFEIIRAKVAEARAELNARVGRESRLTPKACEIRS